MNRKISVGGAITLAIMFSTVTFIMTMIFAINNFNGKMYDIPQREKMYSKLSEVDTKVRKEYLRTIDEDALRDSLIQGYVEGLGDPYAMYLTADQYNQMMNDYEGRMVDIGIDCMMDSAGYILIDEVYADSPAATAGLERGDLIVKVDELAVTAEYYSAAVDALKGEPGTSVTLLVRRGGVENSYTITRRRTEVPSVTSRMIQNIGYLQIREFNDNTPTQFSRALERLMDEGGAEGLVFDVRGNPGGTLESVAAILDILLPEGPIVSATYKDGEVQLLYSSDPQEIDLPMTVLINSKSASAAELFAQALKDYGKARTVGMTTYGKGSMQTIYPLADGSALDITVALYNPPTSPNFDGVGVRPDYEVRMTADQEAMLSDLDEYTDPQLKKAIEVVDATIRNQPEPEPEEDVSSELAPEDDGSDNTESDERGDPDADGAVSSEADDEDFSDDEE